MRAQFKTVEIYEWNFASLSVLCVKQEVMNHTSQVHAKYAKQSKARKAEQRPQKLFRIALRVFCEPAMSEGRNSFRSSIVQPFIVHRFDGGA
jgi:hypothetical protein